MIYCAAQVGASTQRDCTEVTNEGGSCSSSFDHRRDSGVAISCGGLSPATTPSSAFGAVHVGSKTFHYTGREVRFVVPSGVTTLSVRLRGARGAGHSVYYTNFPPLYGRGGRVDAEIPVKPGETLYVNVGGKPRGSGAGGFNGGGSSGTGSGSNYEGAAGGGSSDVREGGDTLKDRILVAGGGGGMGCCFESGDSSGGSGGGETAMRVALPPTVAAAARKPRGAPAAPESAATAASPAEPELAAGSELPATAATAPSRAAITPAAPVGAAAAATMAAAAGDSIMAPMSRDDRGNLRTVSLVPAAVAARPTSSPVQLSPTCCKVGRTPPATAQSYLAGSNPLGPNGLVRC